MQDRAIDPEQMLINAESRLARALMRLSALRRAALHGSYDATEFDRAVMEYRASECEVLDARKAWAESKEAPVATLVDDGEIVMPDATPRLLFAKWLVQSGKLSDWDVADAA